MKLQQITNEYESLFKKVDEFKGENERIFGYGKDFINCKVIHEGDST